MVSVIWNCLAYSNSCVNPIIYNHTSKDFRDAFRAVVLSSWHLRRRNDADTTVATPSGSGRLPRKTGNVVDRNGGGAANQLMQQTDDEEVADVTARSSRLTMAAAGEGKNRNRPGNLLRRALLGPPLVRFKFDVASTNWKRQPMNIEVDGPSIVLDFDDCSVAAGGSSISCPKGTATKGGQEASSYHDGVMADGPRRWNHLNDNGQTLFVGSESAVGPRPVETVVDDCSAVDEFRLKSISEPASTTTDRNVEIVEHLSVTFP